MLPLVRGGLAGAASTADAMHCQVRTIAAAKEPVGEALLQGKRNQKCLFGGVSRGHWGIGTPATSARDRPPSMCQGMISVPEANALSSCDSFLFPSSRPVADARHRLPVMRDRAAAPAAGLQVQMPRVPAEGSLKRHLDRPGICK